MRRVEMEESVEQFSTIVAAVEAGHEIQICRSGKPVARLVPCSIDPSPNRALGALRGQIELRDDFDDLPDEFMRHFR